MVRSGEIVSRDNPKLSFYANTANIDTLSGCTLGESIRGSIAILPSSKSVSIHCSSSSTRSGRSSRSFLCSGKNRIDAGSDAALSVGCGIASTR